MENGANFSFSGSNSFVGEQAGESNSGSNNTLTGYQAGQNNTGGSKNTFYGTQSGKNSSGSGNVFIGYQAGKDKSVSNRLIIANSDTNQPLILGDFSDGELVIFGDLKVTGKVRQRYPVGAVDLRQDQEVGEEIADEAFETSFMMEQLIEENNEIRAENEAIKAELAEIRQMLNGLQNVNGSIEITPVGGSISLQNTPNPFRGSTIINYTLPSNASDASLIITNMNGQQIKTYQGLVESGQVNFDSERLETGVYNCTLYVDGHPVSSRKMILNR